MRVITKITLLNDENEKFFGEGPLRLLRLIGECGSLRAAASVMDMSYSKAFSIVKNTEKTLGFPITIRKIGGRCGGGSMLTGEAEEWLNRYEEYRNTCIRHNEQLFIHSFCAFRIGIVIMASGCGKRFGGNKLMAELGGKPLIAGILETVSGIFDTGIVVTRDPVIAELAESFKFRSVLHDFPDRNDAVRLGISSLPSSLTGCIFFQADQPFISKETIFELLKQVSDHPDMIIRFNDQGNPSPPVYFPKWAFEDLCLLPCKKGGSYLFSLYPEKIMDLPVSDSAEFTDIDTKDDLIKAGLFLKNRENA